MNFNLTFYNSSIILIDKKSNLRIKYKNTINNYFTYRSINLHAVFINY